MNSEYILKSEALDYVLDNFWSEILEIVNEYYSDKGDY